MMRKTGILVVTTPNKFLRFIPRLQKEIEKTLYVQILSDTIIKKPNLIKVNSSNCSSTIVDLYCNSVNAIKLDIRILLACLKDRTLRKISTKQQIEVVYFDKSLNIELMEGFVKECLVNKSNNCQMIALQTETEQMDNDECVQFQKIDNMYDNVVLGGTFDRLHCGHKALLSEAVLRCTKKVTVGVTDIEMLKSKKLWELIEPCQKRINDVRDFLEDIDPNLEYDVVPINDMYGPTKSDPSFQMIVVSSETVKGGDKVNQLRLKNCLNSLIVHSVNLLPDIKRNDMEEDKISSSNDRLRLLGKLIKSPEPKKYLSPLPYIIGLTGGITSGKTGIANRLEKLGAGVVNCDKLAHELYRKGESFYSFIIDKFGNNILNQNGDIDRKLLGSLVFNNEEKLNQLNNLLWPNILKKAKELSTMYYNDGKHVVVLEAAVLLQANWMSECHELWTCIIPSEEAIVRLKNRNNLTEDEAKIRLQSQPSNVEQVEAANVVFCTLWSPNFTQVQVERAWNELQERLPVQV